MEIADNMYFVLVNIVTSDTTALVPGYRTLFTSRWLGTGYWLVTYGVYITKKIKKYAKEKSIFSSRYPGANSARTHTLVNILYLRSRGHYKDSEPHLEPI